MLLCLSSFKILHWSSLGAARFGSPRTAGWRCSRPCPRQRRCGSRSVPAAPAEARGRRMRWGYTLWGGVSGEELHHRGAAGGQGAGQGLCRWLHFGPSTCPAGIFWPCDISSYALAASSLRQSAERSPPTYPPKCVAVIVAWPHILLRTFRCPEPLLAFRWPLTCSNASSGCLRCLHSGSLASTDLRGRTTTGSTARSTLPWRRLWSWLASCGQWVPAAMASARQLQIGGILFCSKRLAEPCQSRMGFAAPSPPPRSVGFQTLSRLSWPRLSA